MSEFPGEPGGTHPPPELGEISGPIAARFLGEVETFIATAAAELPDEEYVSALSHGLTAGGELLTIVRWVQPPVVTGNYQQGSAHATRYEVTWLVPGGDTQTFLRITPSADRIQSSVEGWFDLRGAEQPFALTGDELVAAAGEATDKLMGARPIDSDTAIDKAQSVERNVIGGREARRVRASLMPAIEHLLDSAVDLDSETGSHAVRINQARPDIQDHRDGLPIRRLTVLEDSSENPAKVAAFIVFEESPFDTLDPSSREMSKLLVQIEYAREDPADAIVIYQLAHEDSETIEIVNEPLSLIPEDRGRIHDAIALQLELSNLENHVGLDGEDG